MRFFVIAGTWSKLLSLKPVCVCGEVYTIEPMCNMCVP